MSLSDSPLPVQLACGHFLLPHTCPVSAEQPLSRAVPPVPPRGQGLPVSLEPALAVAGTCPRKHSLCAHACP